jgi:hypothetical protein
MTKKIHYKNEFELCYLRHRYVKKANTQLTEQELSPYKAIIQYLSVNTYYMYKALFDIVGLLLDDIISVGEVHLYNFLGLFSLEKNPKKMKEFRSIFKKMFKKKATLDDILIKNKNSFQSFLRQRMEDLVRICKQKARNIKGASIENYVVFASMLPPQHDPLEIIAHYKSLGYKKINNYVYERIKRKAKNPNKVFEFEGKWYIIIPINNAGINEEAMVNSVLNPKENEHNLDPETLLFNKEQNKIFEEKKQKFEERSDEDKMMVFKEFVDKHSGDPLFRKEIRTAKKQIRFLMKKLEINE